MGIMGIFLIMGNTGLISSTVGFSNPQFLKGPRLRTFMYLFRFSVVRLALHNGQHTGSAYLGGTFSVSDVFAAQRNSRARCSAP